jgi:hypothetical protein
MVDAARTEADTDYWKGALILFTSGTITGQCRLITGFNAATDTITFAPATTQAVATQTYEILPAGAVDVRLWNGTAPNDLISGRVDASVGAMAANVVTSSAIAADAIGASQLAANAIGSSELATSAVDEIVDQVWDEIAGTHAAPGSTGSLVSLLTTIDSNVSNVFTQTTILNDATFITTSTVQTGSTSTVVRTTRAEASGYHDNATIVVGNSGVSAVRRIKSYAQTNGAFTVDALPFTPSVGQTVWIIARVAPLSSGSIAAGVWDEARAGHVAAGSFGEGVASVQGNVTGSVASVTGAVGSVAAGGITAASIATDAIDSDAIAASAVTEIQAGLATSAALATVQADTDDIQARLPATLNGGRMRSHVEVMDAGTITAAVIATGAVDADALATDAVTEITVAVDAAVTASHGVGSYVDSGTPPTVGAIADQVWDEVLAGHLTPGSTGFALDAAAAGGAGLTAQQVRDAMKLTPTAGAPAAGSVDEHLDDILADTAAMQPLIDVATSTRATDAGVDAAVTASHGVGSYVDTGAAPSAASVADAVWDEATAGHAIVGSTGEALTQAATGGSAPTVGQIADGVWDELLAGHAIVGSTGEALTDAAAGGAGLTPQQVADALKLAPAAGAPAAGSVYGQLDDIETCACSGGNGDSDVNVEGI